MYGVLIFSKNDIEMVIKLRQFSVFILLFDPKVSAW